MTKSQDLIQDIIDRLQKQKAKGLAKYGRPVVPSENGADYWCNHLLDELTDALVYGHALKATLDQGKTPRENDLEQQLVYRNMDVQEMRHRILCLEETMRSVLEYLPDDVRGKVEVVLEDG